MPACHVTHAVPAGSRRALHGGHVGECPAAAISRKIEMQLRTTARRHVRALPASALLPRPRGISSLALPHGGRLLYAIVLSCLWQYRSREGKLAAGSGS
jgi:hypothetical protein